MHYGNAICCLVLLFLSGIKTNKIDNIIHHIYQYIIHSNIYTLTQMARFSNHLVIVLLLLVSQLKAQCFAGKLITEQYCKSKDEKHAIDISWTHPYPDCLDCQCGLYGLSCCRYAIISSLN